VKTPGGKLAVQYLQKRPRGVMCGDCKCRLPGVRRSANAQTRSRLADQCSLSQRRRSSGRARAPGRESGALTRTRTSSRARLPVTDPAAPPQGVRSPRTPREDGDPCIRRLALRQVRSSAVSARRRRAPAPTLRTLPCAAPAPVSRERSGMPSHVCAQDCARLPR
jgi:ribosomal protein L34E